LGHGSLIKIHLLIAVIPFLTSGISSDAFGELVILGPLIGSLFFKSSAGARSCAVFCRIFDDTERLVQLHGL